LKDNSYYHLLKDIENDISLMPFLPFISRPKLSSDDLNLELHSGVFKELWYSTYPYLIESWIHAEGA